MATRRRTRVGHIKVIIERTEDGYIAYPLGMKGVVVGQGDSYEEALADVTSAIHAHVQEFGREALHPDSMRCSEPGHRAAAAIVAPCGPGR